VTRPAPPWHYRPMDIAFGHTNLDLDCLGSLILVKKLYPGCRLVRSGQIHPAARRLAGLYEREFNFLSPKDLAGQTVERVVIVDTCSAERVREYLGYLRGADPAIHIYDHHAGEVCDILGAELHHGEAGANTSFLGRLAMDRGAVLSPDEATIALAGIYADTGKLLYENVRRVDYDVAAWLLDSGASLRQVKAFIEPITEDDQVVALSQALLVKTVQVIQGHTIALSYLDLDSQVSGLAAVVEKIMDIENPDAYFAFFAIARPRMVLLIARSQKPRIDLHKLLAAYGGGGHQLAASARIRGRDGREVYDEFLAYLDTALSPAVRARDIMTRTVVTAVDTQTLLEASRIMEETDHAGLPVLDAGGALAGYISLKDIMKGRRVRAMHAPVRAYMKKPPVFAPPEATMREVERLFYRHHISHLPVAENGRLVGILSRWDYVEYQKRKDQAAG